MPTAWHSRMFISAGSARRGTRAVSWTTAVALALSFAYVLPEAAAAAPTKAPPATCPGERADPVSASVTARLCRKRVEALSARTERSQLWALPEGGFSSEVYAGPARFKQGEVWKPVDLTLKMQPNGSVAPVGHPRGLRLAGRSGEGEHTLASVNVDGDVLTMAWTGALPAPVLNDNTATYREVLPGVDLVLTATRTGYEQSFVAKDRAAAARVASVTLPLRSKGLRFVADGPGSLAVRNAKGATVARVPTPTMWDSRRDQAGQPTRERPLTVRARPVTAGRLAPTRRRAAERCCLTSTPTLRG